VRDEAGEIEDITDEIRASSKYRRVARETIRDVVRSQHALGGPRKRVVVGARRRLHTVVALYLGQPSPNRWRDRLTVAFGEGDDAVRDTCRRIMAQHLSSRERLPVLSEFYASLFAVTGRPRRIVDLACAYNPLALRWMDLDPPATYHGYDFNSDIVDLCRHYLSLEGGSHRVDGRDVLCSPPVERADVALLLKMYHCLENRRPGAGAAVVEGAAADWVAVSFPSRSASGRQHDFLEQYAAPLRELVVRRAWRTTGLSFPMETVVLVDKRSDRS
jgi:16S rRNA (guanine(1405)-N(7))-methyltransferase